MDTADSVLGSLLGGAAGDALGLPYEGLSPDRAARLLGPADRMRLVFGRGMVSDDTDHARMTLEALCRQPRDADAFARDLGRRLRWWLAALPGGIGSATLRATVRLWLVFPPSRSGVNSAGNGPAMRAAVLGAAIGDPDRLTAFVTASTRLTHTDARALHGALVVALGARCARDGSDFLATCRDHPLLTGTEMLALVERAVAHGVEGHERGVSGFVMHTVPVAAALWLAHPRDLRAALTAAVELGGDADTLAAIVGGVVGAGVGAAGVPRDWLGRIWGWPHTTARLTRLAERAAVAATSGEPGRPPGVLPGATLGRNLVLLVVVLAHAARRVLPPYERAAAVSP